ncbi:hypothetical protein [Granulicoccus phenolivorans]|uniref:hypothetical protein n=1 Tax=Granulicoccus phenolivorans TaxID=266854 RepID=UPI0011AE8FB6|nr:hypothetical protein [Granulicoccus phenolivorans]
MSRINVLGETLAGMAAAARLAKLGHEVTLISDPAAEAELACTPPLPELLMLPAAWRDLFKKSGRPLEAELARAGWQLRAVPSREVPTSHGTFVLPTDRGEQFVAIREAFGTEYATSWRDLLDGLGQIWQARRLSGMEAELQPEHLAEMSSTWWWHTTVAEVATAVDHRVLSPLVLASAQDDDPEHSPAADTMWLNVERTFGLWQVTDSVGIPVGNQALITALRTRLETRGVRRADEPPAHADATVVAYGEIPRRKGLLGRRRPVPWHQRTGPRFEGRYTCGRHTTAGSNVTGQLLSAALATYAVHLDLTGVNVHPSNRELSISRLG